MIREYNHLYQRVEYPLERGYRMEPYPLPSWIKIGIEETENEKQLLVYSNIHVNKEVRINPTYSKNFTDQQVIKDLSGKVSSMFL